MNAPYEHPQFRAAGNVALALYASAAHTARAARCGRRLAARPRRGCCLRPGPATPLWNGLVARARPHLRLRGSKAHLARLLGLPRQRLQDALKARTSGLDAERTLLLLCWIAVREQRRDLSA